MPRDMFACMRMFAAEEECTSSSDDDSSFMPREPRNTNSSALQPYAGGNAISHLGARAFVCVFIFKINHN